jgi:Fe-S-cluster containining protein
MPEQYLWLWPDGALDQDPERWVREGACHRCGLCCELERKLTYTSGHERQEGSEITEELDNHGWPRGSPIAAEDWEGKWVYWTKRTPGDPAPICSAYEGDGICAVHADDDRCEICRKWPILPADLDAFPDCGYSFRRVEG